MYSSGILFSNVILISDALPITKSAQKEANFAGTHIYYDGIKATSENGTIAGSTNLLDEIIHRIKEQEIVDEDIIKTVINNPYKDKNGKSTNRRYHRMPSSFWNKTKWKLCKSTSIFLKYFYNNILHSIDFFNNLLNSSPS